MTGGDKRSPEPVIGTDRLAYVDVMRTVAVLRVVINHALPWPWLKWFESLPVMFFVSGTLTGRSLRNRSAWTVFKGRFSRLAIPTAVYLAFVLVMSLTGVLDGITSHLWYVWTFLLFVAVSGGYRWLIEHALVLSIVVQVAMIVLLTIAGIDVASVAWAYQLAWFTGMVWAARDCEVPPTKFLVATAVGGFTVAIFAVWHWLGFGATITPADPDNIVSPSSLGISMAALGAAWLAVGMLLRGPLEASMHVRGLGVFIRYLNKRLLTIYLWHLPATVVARQWSADLELSPFWNVPFVLAVTFAFTAAATVVLGGLEDRASAASKRVKQAAIDPATD